MLRVIVIVAVMHAPQIASACTILPPAEQKLLPCPATAPCDTTPPSAVTAFAEVRRSNDDCGYGAFIYFMVDATDAVTPTENLGFQFRWIEGDEGDAPDDLAIPAFPVLAFGGHHPLPFNSGDHSGFEIELEITARDLAGNVGPPTIVSVGEGPTIGCSSQRSPAMSWLVALALVTFAWRRRRA